jgi:hypothetical protein
MTVLIAKQNQELVQSLYPTKKLEFVEDSTHTSTFNVGKNVFSKLINTVREKGYNPYALMSW